MQEGKNKRLERALGSSIGAVEKNGRRFGPEELIYTHRAPRATRASTLLVSISRALLYSFIASTCRPDLKCSTPIFTLKHRTFKSSLITFLDCSLQQSKSSMSVKCVTVYYLRGTFSYILIKKGSYDLLVVKMRVNDGTTSRPMTQTASF